MDTKGKGENELNVKILNGITNIAGNNYRMNCTQQMVADIKADTTIDDATKTELLAFSDKVIAAESKISQDAIAIVTKYNSTDNIDPAEPDDDEEYY
jgi:hypothetical protein